MNHNLIEIENLVYSWPGKSNQPFLEINHFTQEKGELTYLYGKSGCGKTTFLNILTGIYLLSEGSLKIGNTKLHSLSRNKMDEFRIEKMGIIFQQFNLLPFLSVLKNVTLPCLFSSKRKQNALKSFSTVEENAEKILNQLQLDPSLYHQLASNLSIGQQQRVAIARALIGNPELIIADEPTSALDEENKIIFLETLFQEAKKINASVILVSHDRSIEKKFDHSYDLEKLNTAQIISKSIIS